jgi:phage terminase large subunit-like protein
VLQSEREAFEQFMKAQEPAPETPAADVPDFRAICRGLTREQTNGVYADAKADGGKASLKRLCLDDLFYLLTIACRRRDIDRDWLFERCREVEAEPDGYLDLWFREGYKSTIITFGKSIQEILIDPDITIGIFSHTRPIAKGFLGQIKTELEQNQFLKDLFPDVLYQAPHKESDKWSLDGGIRVKRSIVTKEETVEAWGLVDGQPTSKHFKLMVYDDVVTRESVTTPEQIIKVTAAWELSLNLGAEGGRKRYIGTRYHANDTYRTMIDRGSVVPRVKPATSNGDWPGETVFIAQESLVQKRRDFGPYTFSAQMLQNPTADKAMGFKEEWLKFYDTIKDHRGWNVYIVVDPASKKKTSSDYSVFNVVGLAPDNNYYLLDAFRDRLNLTQRAKKLFELHRKWEPRSVGYESYGLQADIEHMQYVMEQENYRFEIIELGGSMPKEDRIRQLVPICEQARYWMPKHLAFVDSESRSVDYVKVFVENEYTTFPVSTHDDMLDCLARIVDPVLGAAFPKIKKSEAPRRAVYEVGTAGTGWMG